jgi:predicted AlkP superfamily phosphohydrolase/phosphomutase
MSLRVRKRVVVAVIGPALLALALSGCAGRARVERRLLLVGIDGAEWSVLNGLLEQGKLPNFARLIDSGVACGLRSLEPKQKSPVIWTTIATGKYPDKHGITDYLDATGGKIMTSNVRTARTFWDILGEDGHKVTVVGWLVSWPAEPVNGSMVTDYFRYPPKPDRPLPEKLTYPDGLLKEVEPLRVSAESISDEDVAHFVDLDRRLSNEEIHHLPVPKMFLEMNALNEAEQMIAQLRDFMAGDRTFLGVARYLMGKHPTQISAVYLRGVDSVSHKFWPAAHPGEVGFEVSQTEVGVFGHTLERYYEYADEMLGELLDAFGDGGTVIVCSDHGFEGPKPGKQPGGIRDHGPVGVLVLAGKDIRPGARISERRVEDITPTILALYGLPVADDMDGSVIADALSDAFLRAHPVARTASYELPEAP